MRRFLIFAFVMVASCIRRLMMRSDIAFKILFLPGTGRARTVIGLWKAWYVFEQAKRDCPAYAAFCAEHGCEVTLPPWGWVPDLSKVVPMDKANFIKKYSMRDRCLGGKMPLRGAVIDQSSGSTGKPTNWVRGPEERQALARVMQLSLRMVIDHKKPLFFVNAFALGPWATGMTVSYSVSDEVLLISTGPDIDKIVGTLTDPDFGPDNYTYVIAGYPPFLKMLVDSGKLDWKKFDAIAFYGGEGMSEGMRSYLLEAFREVYGDYGASDLEINIGAENAFTVGLRRLMMKDEKLRRALNQGTSKYCPRVVDGLPHIFQYNQMDYVVESTDQGELLITLCRASNVSPRIKYNIHDNGHVMTYGAVRDILRAHGYDPDQLGQAVANLPLMFHYGRSDLAASYYGCKIPPTDIEKIIFEIPDLARITKSFRMITSEDAEHNKHLLIAFELGENKQAPADVQAISDRVFELLMHHNQDYRESARIAAQKGVVAKIQFFGFNQGPFEGSDIRLKQKYTEEK